MPLDGSEVSFIVLDMPDVDAQGSGTANLVIFDS
jgi:hypothetical protein